MNIFNILCMKRFILFSSIAAMVLLSAFTVVNKAEKKPFANLYWYAVSGAGIDHNSPVNGGTPVSKTTLLANPSMLPCPVGAGNDCVRGFTTIQTANAITGESDRIKKPSPEFKAMEKRKVQRPAIAELFLL